MLISYNWIKEYVPELPSPEDLSNIITSKVCEVEKLEKTESGDYVIEVNVLPDRAHDLLSHQGWAKELSGLLGLEIKEKKQTEILEDKTNLEIKIESPSCYRYMARIIRGVKVGPSPDWLKQKLESIGQRSINNIVDITNFILFDLGQPIHSFDLDKLKSSKIIIRQAEEAEKIKLLSFGSEEERCPDLKISDLIISDEEKPIAIAGVKGGDDSGIDPSTYNILIEVANFDSVSIRKTAKRLNIQTEAVKRYENGISPILCEKAMGGISVLIKEVCPEAVFEEVIDAHSLKIEKKEIELSKKYLDNMLGIDIPEDEIDKILNNYKYQYTKNNKGSWSIEIPVERLDILGPHNLVEEIGRVYGYDKIEPVMPNLKTSHIDNSMWTKIIIAKNKLREEGYQEVITSVFGDKGDMSVLASASDKNFLRNNLSDGLRTSLELNIKNLTLLETNEIKIFEVGSVFTKNKEEVKVAFGDKNKIEELGLDEYYSTISEEERNDSIFSQKEIKDLKYFKPWSVFPFIVRDISIWVPKDTDSKELENLYKEIGGELLIRDPVLIDEYQKEEKTSYTYRLVFQSLERTLTDEEIAPITDAIYSKVKDLGYEIR